MTYLKEGIEYNNKNILYLLGDEHTDGSIKLSSVSGMTIIGSKIDGIWQPAPLESMENWMGQNVGITGIGHHLVTEFSDGHPLHFHAHSEFDGELSIADTKIVHVFQYIQRSIVVPDNSGEWVGTSYTYNYFSTDHRMFQRVYYQTGAIAARENVTFQVWEGTGETGNLIFDQTYLPSNFSADTEIIVAARGFIEFNEGINYFVKISSDVNFSLKTTSDLLYPWTAADISWIREEGLLQTEQYVSGATFTEGQYLISNRKIYVCNTTGVQDGTFESNIALWDLLGSISNDYWYLTGTTLQNKSGINSFKYNNGTTDMLEMDNFKATLRNNAGAYLTMNQNDFEYNDGNNGKRLNMPFDNTQIYDELSTGGGFITLENKTFKYDDGTRDRIEADATESILHSPDGAKSLSVNNIGTTVTGEANFNNKLIKASNPPATSSSLGTTGQIEWDSNYIYVSVATNTWKRTQITTW